MKKRLIFTAIVLLALIYVMVSDAMMRWFGYHHNVQLLYNCCVIFILIPVISYRLVEDYLTLKERAGDE